MRFVRKVGRRRLMCLFYCCLFRSPQMEEFKDSVLAKVEKFVSKNAGSLFASKEKKISLRDETEDTFASVPPLDHFMNAGLEQRATMFFKNVGLYDVLIGEIIENRETFVIARLLCFANGKRLWMDDIKYQAIVSLDGNQKIGSLVKGAVIDSKLDQRRLVLTANIRDLPEDLRDYNVKLGIISENELPLHFKIMKKNEVKREHVSSFFKTDFMHKTGGTERLIKFYIGDSTDPPSFLPYHQRGAIEPKDYASEIAKQRILHRSNMRLDEGQKALQQKKMLDALNMFKESLELNPQNIEALISCAVVYMSWKNYRRAIGSYEKVLTLNNKHERAKQFLCENIKLMIKKCEKEGNYKGVLLYCKKFLMQEYSEEYLDLLLKCLLMFGGECLIGPSWLKLCMSKNPEDVDKYHESDMELEDTGESRIETIAPLTAAVSIPPSASGTAVSSPSLAPLQPPPPLPMISTPKPLPSKSSASQPAPTAIPPTHQPVKFTLNRPMKAPSLEKCIIDAVKPEYASKFKELVKAKQTSLANSRKQKEDEDSSLSEGEIKSSRFKELVKAKRTSLANSKKQKEEEDSSLSEGEIKSSSKKKPRRYRDNECSSIRRRRLCRREHTCSPESDYEVRSRHRRSSSRCSSLERFHRHHLSPTERRGSRSPTHHFHCSRSSPSRIRLRR